MESKKRSVRPYYIIAVGKEIDLANVVKELKKKMKNNTLTDKELKIVAELNKALDKYKKSAK